MIFKYSKRFRFAPSFNKHFNVDRKVVKENCLEMCNEFEKVEGILQLKLSAPIIL